MLFKRWKNVLGMVLIGVVFAALSGCGIGGERFEQSWTGVSATIHTYNENGAVLDKVHGRSIRITRDTEFDQHDKDGNVTKPSSMMSISIGKYEMTHVGSTLVTYEDGLRNVMDQYGATFDVDNKQFGVPWLNKIKFQFQNYFLGKSRIIVVRSQNGTPLAVFGGNSVQSFSTEVPNSTWFEIDGKMLFVYRADMTAYDIQLIERV
jgi:hypothetical protein